MKINLPVGVTRQIGRTIFQAKKNSPHIFFGVGVVSVAGSAVLACRATLKLEQTLDEIKADVDKVKTVETIGGEKISHQERQRLLAVKYGRGVGKLTRLYGPAAVLGLAGIGCLTGSHVQLTRRNAAVSGALALVSQAFDDYRARVRADMGEDAERDLYHNVAETSEIVDGKKTKVKTVNKEGFGKSPYARIFDESSEYWENSSELNLMFLRCMQKHFNDRLHAFGYVFLNDVYEALGFERTPYGQMVGWLRNETFDPNLGDGYIDFGIYDLNNGKFVNGMERSVLLDFNVDGEMYNRI